jgi:hypothetical protein
MQHADRSALKQRDPLVADFGTALFWRMRLRGS